MGIYGGRKFFVVSGEQSWLIGGMDSGSLSGLQILIVEDEPLLRRQMAAQLEKLGADGNAGRGHGGGGDSPPNRNSTSRSSM